MLTTAIPHPRFDTLQTSHLPFVLDVPPTSAHSGGDSPPPPLGTLRGHLTRINPQALALIDKLREAGTQVWSEDILILFNAPVNHYVPPRFYVETKPTTTKVVPTWNYAAVQVYGRVKVYHSRTPETSDFLQQQLTDLVELMEPKHGGEWRITDAPAAYIEGRKPGIVGIEIEITKMEGRFKLSQEREDGDWKGVVDGFRGLGTDAGVCMARMIEARGVNRCDE